MSEKMPNNRLKEIIDLEKGEDGTWQLLKEQARAEAVEIIVDKSVEELQVIMDKLSVVNENRFLVEEIARLVTAKRETEIYMETMKGLGISVGNSIDVKV